MFNPDLRNVLKNNMSRYSLVTAVAKRAREIAIAAEENQEVLNEKPVSLALDEIIAGDVTIVEPEEIRNI